jgi:gluconolactonase
MPEQPANLAWGGADLDTIYITATTSLYKLTTEVNGFVPYLHGARPTTSSSR